MVNMKEMVYAALVEAFGESAVSDSWPEELNNPNSGGVEQIVYTEEDNRSHERSGSRTTKSYCRFRIDILSVSSTSGMAAKVDEVLACDNEGHGLGMTRTMCRDDNTAYQKHKIMRYECIVGDRDNYIYGIN